MIKSVGFIGMTATIALLCGCQQMSAEFGKINAGLSPMGGQKTAVTQKNNTTVPSKKSIKNAWHVCDRQAIAWLKQNQLTWNDHGKLNGVNWYHFWKAQIQANTTLSKTAYQICHNNPVSGANCQTYWQAYSMSKSEESRYWGSKRDGGV